MRYQRGVPFIFLKKLGGLLVIKPSVFNINQKTLGADIKLRRTSTIIIKYNLFYFLSPHIIRSPMLAKRQIRKRMVPVLEEYTSPIHPNKPSTSPNANSPNAIAR